MVFLSKMRPLKYMPYFLQSVPLQTLESKGRQNGRKVNIVNLKQNSILHAQRTLNYEAKIKIKFNKRLTFLQKFTISLLDGHCDHSTHEPRCLSLCLLIRTIYIAFRRYVAKLGGKKSVFYELNPRNKLFLFLCSSPSWRTLNVGEVYIIDLRGIE